VFKFVLGIVFGAVLHSAYLKMPEVKFRYTESRSLQQLSQVPLDGKQLRHILKPGEVYEVTGHSVHNGKKIAFISLVGSAPDSAEIWTHEFDLAMQPVGTRFRFQKEGSSHFVILGSHDA
jgi:hypothetical protein